MKDELEAILARDVCAGLVPISEAQRAIATDWRAAYKQYVRPWLAKPAVSVRAGGGYSLIG